MEKRLSLTILVHLAEEQNCALSETELTYTENISAHGVCVISRRAWNVDEVAEVTALEDEFAQRGRVVHCRKRGKDLYAVGLAFRDAICWPHAAAREAVPSAVLARSF